MTDRLFYRDSFVRAFAANVTDIREASRADGISVWQIALDRTAFYPTSGGQPHDTGVLRATSRNGAILEAAIESVEEDESGQVWHYTRKPLQAGTTVEGEIDWSRRLDHIQQHSGQHLLSAVFARELSAPTVSFHLGETVSTIDLATAPIARHTLQRIERIANELIAEDRAVSVRTVERAEAESLLATGDLRKLPEREGSIRLIEIADYDLNACGGTHVRSTGQIGGLLIRSVEKVSRGFRVEFLCGLRAADAARHDFELLGRAAGTLSTKPEEIPAAVERLVGEAKAAAKERQKLLEEVATYHATRLVVEELFQENLRLVCRMFADRGNDYIRLLGSKVTASVPRTVALLASTESSPARVVLARSGDIDIHCGEMMKKALADFGFRGGGSPDLAQGDLPQDEVVNFLAIVTRELRAALIPHRTSL
ncbi:alanyl-tRNA synthetase [Silvibacterium bohemicum]|uniref:Alanine--tRNA ligase n=1 Tax=Silvibacterium bohemicum TaxID=1577686 RepID=A0A841JVU8_9BACT|nr:alanine--tRNA ligase-related protein [Silvibacterium bohemicum]MBB6144587.1 alanyl-tRNA synthetase [Silvibacterium bohemicum]